MAPNTVLNKLKSVQEKRYDLMRNFFDNLKIEIRVTHGPRWEDVLMSSIPDHCKFLSKCTKDVMFERNSQINESKNIFLYTESMKKFQVRIAYGLQLERELTHTE